MILVKNGSRWSVNLYPTIFEKLQYLQGKFDQQVYEMNNHLRKVVIGNYKVNQNKYDN